VDAVRATCQRDIQPIVHHHSRHRAAAASNCVRDQSRQIARLEIAFADLNHINACSDPSTELFIEGSSDLCK
jgi:hypothetical protein